MAQVRLACREQTLRRRRQAMTEASRSPSGHGRGLAFPRTARMCAKAQFDQVFQNGRRCAGPLLTVHWLEEEAPARLGLAVSRRVDSRAVGRNRIKRVLRDAFRHERFRLRGGAFVVVARAPAAQADGTALRAAFTRCLIRLGALPPPPALGTMPPAASTPPSPPTQSQ